MTPPDIILAAAALRGSGEPGKAIELIEKHRGKFGDLEVNALLQAFSAATEIPHLTKARYWAREVAALEPLLPSIKDYL